MREEKVRYAVVGLGDIAQRAVLPAFAHAKENSELVALVSSDANKLATLAERYRVTTTGHYDDLERILTASRADAVYVAVPNTMHREIAERAARARANVLCEKPLAMSVDDSWAMIDACKKNDVLLMVGYRLHFEHANLDAIEAVRSGQIGEPRVFSSVFCQQVRQGDMRTKAALGGGALFDMGVYCINAARNLFREEPELVMGTLAHSPDDPRFSEVDEVASGILGFSRGRVAQFTASQGACDIASYSVLGTTGKIRVEDAFRYTAEINEELTSGEHRHVRTYPKRDQFAPELVYFSSCIMNGTEPEPSGEEGLCDVRVMTALVESARTSRPIHLPRFTRAQRPDIRLEMRKPALEAR
jgi:predicted dehydrogenase